MKDKFIMVAGVGASKFLQLLFSLYLSYQFDHGALATFVLILTLSIAMSSIVSLGGASQIVRAGAYSDSKKHIISIVGTALILIVLALIVLFLFIVLGQHDFSISDFNKFDYYFNTAFILTSLALYSIVQSYLSYKQEYFKLGVATFIIYSAPFLLAIISSQLDYSAAAVIFVYSISFLLSSLFVYFFTVNKEIKIGNVISLLPGFRVLRANIVNFIRVSLFGFITMLSLYFSVKYVNNNYNEQLAALYSVSYQFFQIGIFLPSVLGAVFIPKLVKNNNKDENNVMKKSYFFIAISWVAICSIMFYPIFKLYDFSFSKNEIITFIVMQLGVVLSSLQASYNQRYVAMGNFNFLALNAFIWGGALLLFQYFSPHIIYFSSWALVFAYSLSLLAFFSKDNSTRVKQGELL